MHECMIAVVIPCYKVSAQVAGVLARIGGEVSHIFVVDDGCPEKSGALVENTCHDPRIRVLYHAQNQGVGAAVLTGYRAAMEACAEVIVKLDGDGQMDPALIGSFAAPILAGDADYTKGNRFFEVESVRAMPWVRLAGNAALSFLTKLSSGYWNLFDPTNGYTAISARVAACLPLAKLSPGYFFESDILFRLNTLRAVVADIPMRAQYAGEPSSLSVRREMPHFLCGNLRNLCKRIAYNYFLRNFNYASLELLFGLPLLLFGILFGGSSWLSLRAQGAFASAGTVMLAALPVIMGFQLLLGFAGYDMANIPSEPLQGRLPGAKRQTP